MSIAGCVVLVRGLKSEPMHDLNSFKWTLPGYRVVSCYHVGQPCLVTELKNNLFFPILVGYFAPFCNKSKK
jgi:hypothetical protein